MLYPVGTTGVSSWAEPGVKELGLGVGLRGGGRTGFGAAQV